MNAPTAFFTKRTEDTKSTEGDRRVFLVASVFSVFLC